jgi:PHD/YefM family antitoxin component YafN of YafNO toxin-antitoxin module
MNIIDLIAKGKHAEVQEKLFNRLNEIAASRLKEAKIYVTENDFDFEELGEAASRNIIRQGRIQKIRRRIRRNKQGRIVVQKNVRRSAIKGYKLSGNKLVRIPAAARLQKTRKLKRYWKTKGRAKLGRTLLKRKMSLRRRQSMGIK